MIDQIMHSNATEQIGAIVVTYLPKEALLKRVLQNLGGQVKKIYLIDNTPQEALQNFGWLDQSWLAQFGLAIDYAAQGENLGIASAQNIGIEKALADQMTDLLFFDQDSMPPPNLCQHLMYAREQLERDGVRVGAIGPLILDEKSNEPSPIIQSGKFWVYGYQPQMGLVDPIPAEYIISSGSLIAATTIKKVGPMLGKLFIDWVDVEWGQRAQKRGYQNFVLPTVVMRHSIGDDFVRMGKKVINLHSDLRNFYIVRNAAYLVLHYRFQLAWQITVLLKLPIYIFFFTLHAKGPKIVAFKVLVRAFVLGLVGKLGPAPNDLFSGSTK